ncbi:hypothetical protein EJ08DRAFT_692131 [Tothia fuscella]|uniref:Uncharacterized protein n=1 Tax=Tothia fuscella TaxID=1048955 RepID=A0A9P4P128_9PEZI|nr:hypothetical protein EJ08DRAFT_692131 [Tothia fuscella]
MAQESAIVKFNDLTPEEINNLLDPDRSSNTLALIASLLTKRVTHSTLPSRNNCKLGFRVALKKFLSDYNLAKTSAPNKEEVKISPTFGADLARCCAPYACSVVDMRLLEFGTNNTVNRGKHIAATMINDKNFRIFTKQTERLLIGEFAERYVAASDERKDDVIEWCVNLLDVIMEEIIEQKKVDAMANIMGTLKVTGN